MPSFPNINLGSLMALPNIKTSFLGGILVENACQDIYLLHNADCKRQNISPRPVYVICTAKRQWNTLPVCIHTAHLCYLHGRPWRHGSNHSGCGLPVCRLQVSQSVTTICKHCITSSDWLMLVMAQCSWIPKQMCRLYPWA